MTEAPRIVPPNVALGGADRQDGFTNASGIIEGKDQSERKADDHSMTDPQQPSSTKLSAAQLDFKSNSDFPTLAEAAHAKVHVDSRENLALTAHPASTELLERDGTEVSGSGNSHSAGHLPDRAAHITRGPDMPDEAMTDELPIEHRAHEELANIHDGPRHFKKLQESNFVNRDIPPKERAAREAQSVRDKKYIQEHAMPPEHPYEPSPLDEEERRQEKLREEAVQARKQTKQVIQRERRYTDKLADKEVQRLDADLAGMRGGAVPPHDPRELP